MHYIRHGLCLVNRLWKYWCKAMGSHAYDDDKKDDHIHLTIRTFWFLLHICLLYTSPSPRDVEESRMPSSA